MARSQSNPVSEARHAVREARNDRLERAAAFWQQGVVEGRVIRQARAEMTAGESQTQQPQTRSSQSQAP